MADESIIAKIHKLLALATSDNENEAALAAAKAQTLLLEYNVSQEELEEFSTVKNEKVIEIRTKGKTKSRIAWRGKLAGVIAKANLCRLILTDGSGLIWIGKKTNLEVAQYIYDTVSQDLERIASKEWKQVEHTLSHGKTWKNNFYFGAIQTISERLNSNLIALKEVPSATALIVRNDIELKDFEKIHYPFLYHVYQGARQSDRSAFEAGKSAGRSIQFGRGVGSGGSLGPKLLGEG